MTMPYLTTQQITQLSALVSQYIASQQEKYRPQASPLDSQLKDDFAGFFSTELLQDVRLLVLTEERVANPDLYPTLFSMGFDNLPDQSKMQAITFMDTIVSHGLSTDGTFFHELVHLEQYRQLGRDAQFQPGRR